jgi:hypothetical protein
MISIETNSPLSKLFHPVIVIKTYIQNVSYLVHAILHFLKNVFIITAKGILPRVYVNMAEFHYPVYTYSFIPPKALRSAWILIV